MQEAELSSEEKQNLMSVKARIESYDISEAKEVISIVEQSHEYSDDLSGENIVNIPTSSCNDKDSAKPRLNYLTSGQAGLQFS